MINAVHDQLRRHSQVYLDVNTFSWLIKMEDEPYERYIAAFRTLIENHGSQNAIYALEQAFKLESEDNTHTEHENNTLCAIADELKELYYGIEKL